jgi:hypothetical protein
MRKSSAIVMMRAYWPTISGPKNLTMTRSASHLAALASSEMEIREREFRLILLERFISREAHPGG